VRLIALKLFLGHLTFLRELTASTLP